MRNPRITPSHALKKKERVRRERLVNKREVEVKSDRWVRQNPVGKSYRLAKTKKIYLKN